MSQESSTEHKVDKLTVAEPLQNVLASPYFRATAQCSSLLTYIVENTLAARDEQLRERVIGCEVFSRKPDYDTGNDHVVRSRAAEVRKRLALYYQHAGHSDALRISVPSGSYRAAFDVVPRPAVSADAAATDTDVVDPPADAFVSTKLVTAEFGDEPSVPGALRPAQSFQVNLWRVATGLALLGCLLLAAYPRHLPLRQTGNYSKFWAPLLNNPKPVLIYCGGGFVYKLSDAYLENYKQQHNIDDPRNEFFVNLRPDDAVKGADLVPDKHFVPFGDLATTARVTSLLTQTDKPYDLRYGEDVAFTELHSSPVILIGGLNNTWALRITHDLRYVLAGDDRIIDRTDPHTVWQERVDPEKHTRDDYAVISWLNQSETGGFVLSIAGIRTYGNRAAADLLTDPEQMERILAKAPAGWEKHNLQIVIHTRTASDIPLSVDVLAAHYW